MAPLDPFLGIQAALTAKPLRRDCTPQAQTLMDTLHSFTTAGAYMEFMEDRKGTIKEGYLADLLLVDGDPLANLSILRDPKRVLAVMKDGVFAKAPAIASQRTWERAA